MSDECHGFAGMGKLINKIVISWVPVIGAGIIIYVIYEALKASLLYKYASYEDLIRLTLTIAVGAAAFWQTGREVTKMVYACDPRRGPIIKFLLQLSIVSGVLIALAVEFVRVTPSVAAFSGTAVGLILGLAVQQSLSSVFAGIIIILSSPFKPGNRVTIVTWQYGVLRTMYPHEGMPDGFTGVVTDMTLLYTTIIDDKGITIRIPNSVLVQAMIINHDEAKYRMVRVRLDLPVSIPISKFEEEVRRRLMSNPLIKSVRVTAEETWQSTTLYQAAVEVVGDSSIAEKDLRDAAMREAISVRATLTSASPQ
ncbi:MAG: mechanosensitive ion channel family protein [Thermocladium sp.]